MATIRPETEVDRTEQALAGVGATLPLASGLVQVNVDPAALEHSAGQQTLVVLVQQLARMKGLVEAVHIHGLVEQPVLPRVPLSDGDLRTELAALVETLNHQQSDYHARIEFESARSPDAELRLGAAKGSGLAVGADGWRALLGRDASSAAWATTSPVGPALAGAVASAEVFKRLLVANYGDDPARRLLTELAFSGFNYATGRDAAAGPELGAVSYDGWAILGCGAGGTAALYVAAMVPKPTGALALVEPGVHKESNLARYLMTTAAEVHGHHHKMETVARHFQEHAPTIELDCYPQTWETVTAPPWGKLVSTVDTVSTRWEVQRRAPKGAAVLDAAVVELQYTLLRVISGGWCLECKHPFEPEHEVKQRAAAWGQDLAQVKNWQSRNQPVTQEMIERMAEVQNQPSDDYEDLLGTPFAEVPQRTECGETRLRIDVPSQTPTLPIATTTAGVLLAGELIKADQAPSAQLCNWWGHYLGDGPRTRSHRFRAARASCPRHPGSASGST